MKAFKSKAWDAKGLEARSLGKGKLSLPSVDRLLGQVKSSGRPMKVKLSMKVAIKPGRKVDGK